MMHCTGLQGFRALLSCVVIPERPPSYPNPNPNTKLSTVETVTRHLQGGIGGPTCGGGGVNRTEMLVFCGMWHRVLLRFTTRSLSTRSLPASLNRMPDNTVLQACVRGNTLLPPNNFNCTFACGWSNGTDATSPKSMLIK